MYITLRPETIRKTIYKQSYFSSPIKVSTSISLKIPNLTIQPCDGYCSDELEKKDVHIRRNMLWDPPSP